MSRISILIIIPCAHALACGAAQRAVGPADTTATTSTAATVNTTATAETADATDPAEAAASAAVPAGLCEAAEASAARVLRDADAAVGALTDERVRNAWRDETAPLRSCHAAGRGAWMLVPSSASARLMQGVDDFGQEVEGFGWEVAWRLGYLTAGGGLLQGGREMTVTSNPVTFERYHVGVIAVLDFDSDGSSELILQHHSAHHEHSSSGYAFWSVVNGSLGTYPPAERIDLVRIYDYDEDGRMDILSSTRYWSQPSGGMDSGPEGMPPVLFHSRPDGSFSASDEVAARFLRAACPARPRRLFDPSGGPSWQFEAFKQVACARLWGGSRVEVERQLRRQWRALSTQEREYDMFRLEDYLGHAAVEPPLQLD